MTAPTEETALQRARRRYRERGRQINVVLRDPAVIRALEAGICLHGGPLAAISAALVLAYGEDHPTAAGSRVHA